MFNVRKAGRRSDCECVSVCSLRRRVLDLRDAMREGEERNTLCGIVAVKGDNVC